MRWRREAVTTAVWSQLRHTADCTHTSSRFRFFFFLFFSFFLFGLKPISGKEWIRSIQTQIVNPCNRFENIYNKKKINVFIETSLTSHVISPPPCAPPLHLSFLRSPSCNNMFIYSNLLCRFFYSADAEQKQKHGLIFLTMSEETSLELLASRQLAGGLLCNSRALLLEDAHTWLRHPSGKYYSHIPHGYFKCSPLHGFLRSG